MNHWIIWLESFWPRKGPWEGSLQKEWTRLLKVFIFSCWIISWICSRDQILLLWMSRIPRKKPSRKHVFFFHIYTPPKRKEVSSEIYWFQEISNRTYWTDPEKHLIARSQFTNVPFNFWWNNASCPRSTRVASVFMTDGQVWFHGILFSVKQLTDKVSNWKINILF